MYRSRWAQPSAPAIDFRYVTQLLKGSLSARLVFDAREPGSREVEVDGVIQID